MGRKGDAMAKMTATKPTKSRAAPAKPAPVPASTVKLAAGDRAPDFSLPDGDGGMRRLKDHAGRKLVLYFYPKDDTSGCTAEAIDFNRLRGAFDEAGTAILGVSPDDPASHAKFASKHGLSIPLAADEDKDMLVAYGVWAEKSMYGRKYMGVERTTMLIGPDGRILRVWDKVKVPGHAEEVLEAAKAAG
ncbi:MAG: peroxiredoxin [Hyphomicrobiales bacterium]|nr:peroxiredoxin [Hyphomicrobiales bacterium]MDE2017271.1 peroxiredoxin [Hyphomicrobiales bacterium]